jgi:hypothetical protein
MESTVGGLTATTVGATRLQHPSTRSPRAGMRDWRCGRNRFSLFPRSRNAATRCDKERLVANGYRQWSGSFRPAGGGRTRWAHLGFTRIKITPTSLHKKIEDLREVGAPRSVRRVRAPSLSCLDRLGAHGFRPTSFDTDSGSLRPSRLGCHPDDIRGARICIRRQR